MAVFNWKIGDYVVSEQFDESKDIFETLESTEHPETIPDEEDKSDKDKALDDNKPQNPGLPSDYLFEIAAVNLMANAVNELGDDFKPNETQIDIGLHTFFEYFYWCKKTMCELYKFSSEELGDDADKVRAFIKQCHSISPEEYGRETGLLIREEWESVWEQKGKEFYKIYRKILGFYENDNNRAKPRPYELYRQMACCVSDQIETRLNLVKRTNHVYKYFPSSERELTCLMVLDSGVFGNYLITAIGKISEICSDIGSKFLSSNSIKDKSFNNAIKSMRKTITGFNSGASGGNTDPFRKYHGKQLGCFAILDTPNNKRFISFSGCFDARHKVIKAKTNFQKNKKDNLELQRNIRKMIRTHSELNGSTYARVTLGVLRYNYGASSSNYDFVITKNTKNTEYYKRRSLKKEIRRGIPIGELREQFSCCERKLFSRTYRINSGDCKLFTRHNPCPKCEPAIRDFVDRTHCKLKVYCLNPNYTSKKEILDDYPKLYNIKKLLK